MVECNEHPECREDLIKKIGDVEDDCLKKIGDVNDCCKEKVPKAAVWKFFLAFGIFALTAIVYGYNKVDSAYTVSRLAKQQANDNSRAISQADKERAVMKEQYRNICEGIKEIKTILKDRQ